MKWAVVSTIFSNFQIISSIDDTISIKVFKVEESQVLIFSYLTTILTWNLVMRKSQYFKIVFEKISHFSSIKFSNIFVFPTKRKVVSRSRAYRVTHFYVTIVIKHRAEGHTSPIFSFSNFFSAFIFKKHFIRSHVKKKNFLFDRYNFIIYACGNICFWLCLTNQTRSRKYTIAFCYASSKRICINGQTWSNENKVLRFAISSYSL